MKVVKVSRKLAIAQTNATAFARAAGHHPADWHTFSQARASTRCVIRGCRLVFTLDLTGTFGQDKGTMPACPYLAPTPRAWQFGDASEAKLTDDSTAQDS